MDNQQNQSDTPLAGADIRVQNAGSTGATDRAATGASASSASSSRKSAGAPSAQSTEAQPEGSLLDTALESGKSALESGKTAIESGRKWVEGTGVLDSVNQLPQSVKDWGTRAAARVGGLSTTQKVVGGALLAAGLGWLATRKGKSSKSDSPYSSKSSGGYVRKGNPSYGYQAPDASSRRPAASSGSAYGNSNKSGASYGGASSSDYGSRTSASTTSGQSSDSGFGAKSEDYRNVE